MPADGASVAAVEFRGVAYRRRDRMGRLPPFDELRGGDATGNYSLRVAQQGIYRVAADSVTVPEAAVRNGSVIDGVDPSG